MRLVSSRSIVDVTPTGTRTNPYPGSRCIASTSSGYKDIHVGTLVTLRDENGKLIDTTTLRTGFDPGGRQQECEFPFSFGTVALTYKAYSVEVASRGEITYTLEKLMDRNYRFGLKLGSL